MDATWSEWLNLFIRWAHVFAGILWVGTTYYFTWLDGRLSEEEAAGEHKPQVWMVHSGGFYIVEKQKTPELLPRKLHWFRWEAAATWLSGMALLAVVYYGGGILTDDSVAAIGTGAAIGLSIGVLLAGWVVYDLLWQFVFARVERLGAVVSYALLVATAYALVHVFSARAAYIQVGAMMGTIMAANVWMRILPAQRNMIAATKAGRAPDMSLGARAKQRSKHNTFLVIPVVFLMISNHFPVATYGNHYNWLVLAAFVLLGWGAAAILRRA